MRLVCDVETCPVVSVTRNCSTTMPFKDCVGSNVPSNALVTFTVPDAIGRNAASPIILYSSVQESSAVLLTEPSTLMGPVTSDPFAGVDMPAVGAGGGVPDTTTWTSSNELSWPSLPVKRNT